jgi:hypothetical protein
MQRIATSWAALAAALCSTVLAQAEEAEASVSLPISRIVLFSSGVGYFQREGTVDGNAKVDLRFTAGDVNDLLKSLVLEDQGGGRIGTVSYDNRNPIEMTLKTFALDLTANPSMGDLLNQARGERVEITTTAYRVPGKETETLEGVIVGVEKQREPVGRDGVVDVEQLNLLTSDGVRGIKLKTVLRVKFQKSALETEFRKALTVLAAGHDKQKKSVTLNFAGQGKRPVKVAYILESPMWKTSYRLDLAKEKNFLQGWAIVENTTDEDWKEVHMGLVSGRPISFKMDLYEPLFIPRPVVEPELFASLRPPNYAGNLDRDQAIEAQLRNAPESERAVAGRRRAMSAAAGAPKPAMKSMPVTESLDGKNRFDFEGAAGEKAAAAQASALGDYFQYVLKDPITLARQKSALLPIVNQEVGGERFSIYNESVQAKYPLLGLRFHNNTPLHLSQGPITVYENGTYAGDARIPDLQPKEKRLISYAIDLGTEVEPKQSQHDDLMAVKIIKGIMHLTYRLRETKTYTVKNRSEHDRAVLIEHPHRPGHELVSPSKPEERTREVYRFLVSAKPNDSVALDVVEELPRVEQIVLTNLNDDTVRFYIRQTVTSQKVKDALSQALALKAKADATTKQIAREEQALRVIEDDQTRMRNNMARVPQTAEAYKRYLKKFDDQETEIENRRNRITKLQETLDEQTRAYTEFVMSLSVE